MNEPMSPSCDGIWRPALSSGKPMVTMSLYSSFLWYSVSSVEIVSIQIHNDLFGVERIVIVGVVPTQRAGGDVAFLVSRGDVGQRLDHRLLDLRIVEMRPAVVRDDPLAAMGDQEVVEQCVAVGRSVGSGLETQRIETAHAFLAQFLLHRLEEIPESVPGLRRVRHFVTGLLDQRVPNVDRRHGPPVGNAVVATLLRNVVEILGRKNCRRMVLRLLGLNDVSHVDKPVVPGILWYHRLEGGLVTHQIRDVAAGQCGDDLLHQRPERNEAGVNGVAARLFVLRDHVAEGIVLLADEALDPPYACGLGCRVGNERSPEGSGCRESDGTVQHRTPAKLAHGNPPGTARYLASRAAAHESCDKRV